MIDYHLFFNWLQENDLQQYMEHFNVKIQSELNSKRHGDLRDWLDTLEKLPTLNNSKIQFNEQLIINADAIHPLQHQQLLECLQQLIPWRKGPFFINDLHIDAEWRSDFKWQRIQPHLSIFPNARVLDVGCGNGYFMLQMLQYNPQIVLGIDTSPRVLVQFYMLKKLIGAMAQQSHLLPLGIDDFPHELPLFDIVFSMGVLYHRKSPIEHLQHLFQCLKPKGQLILETLIVEPQEYNHQSILFPKNRYACMPNVWFIPSCEILRLWLERCHFKNITLCDVTTTTYSEQRSTAWMPSHSLDNFLNSQNPNLTLEGYPAPKRAVFSAFK